MIRGRIHTDLALEAKERYEEDNVEIRGVCIEEEYNKEKDIRTTLVKTDTGEKRIDGFGGGTWKSAGHTRCAGTGCGGQFKDDPPYNFRIWCTGNGRTKYVSSQRARSGGDGADWNGDT